MAVDMAVITVAIKAVDTAADMAVIKGWTVVMVADMAVVKVLMAAKVYKGLKLS
jgi:hypothetical protein